MFSGAFGTVNTVLQHAHVLCAHEEWKSIQRKTDNVMHLHTQKFKKMFLVIVNIAALKLHEKSNEKRENHTIIEL